MGLRVVRRLTAHAYSFTSQLAGPIQSDLILIQQFIAGATEPPPTEPTDPGTTQPQTTPFHKIFLFNKTHEIIIKRIKIPTMSNTTQ